MNLSLKNLNISLQQCNIFNNYDMPEPVKFPIRTVNHYEFDFFLESDGGVEINGKYFPFMNNEINFRKPGQIVCGFGRYHCYCISLSFTEATGGKMSLPLCDALNKLPDKIVGQAAEQMGFIIKKIYEYHMCNDFLLMQSELYKLAHELFSFHHNNTLFYNNYVKQATGMTPNQFLTQLRIEKAKYLLLTTNMQIKDIGFECGFDDQIYFTYLFRKETGVPASAFRARERNHL